MYLCMYVDACHWHLRLAEDNLRLKLVKDDALSQEKLLVRLITREQGTAYGNWDHTYIHTCIQKFQSKETY